MSRHVQTYGPAVRIGNWNEDIYLEEGILKDFIAKKENGQLLIQRIQNILDTFLKKTELSVTQDGFVHFGDKVMVINPGQEPSDVPLIQMAPPRKPVSISINAEESMLYNDNNIKPPVELTGSKIMNPCRRNTLIITTVDGTPNGETLCFGQPFTLATLPGYTSNMKLWSDHLRFNQRSRKSNSQLVNFVNETNYMCVWHALALDPQQRLETEGLPIPANAKIVIHHCKTGEKLCLMSEVGVKTPFGREFEIVANTQLDPHNAEKDSNHWVFVTGNPEDTTTTVEQRVQKNVNDDDELNEQAAEEESRKHWLHPKPNDAKPTCSTYGNPNAPQFS